MKFGQVKVLAVVLSFAILFPSMSFAQNLFYSDNQNDPLTGEGGNLSAQNNTNAVPYNTSYGPQFSPYASYMQSPYGMNHSYGTVPQVMPQNYGPSDANANITGRNNDPYAASEVSPFAKYSPYMEVQGEGSNYTLGIDDVVTIIVRNQPDFSGRYVVDPEGNVQYNFAGSIKAAGKTKEELKAAIMERLKEFVRYPEVAVMISEYRSKAVYVFGYVNAPGKYAMKGDKITVKEAVVAAGLPRVDGALKRVYVIRPSEYTDTGVPEAKKVNLQKLLYDGDSAENFLLLPGDTVVVNQRYFDKFVNNFSRLVGPVFQAAAVYELGFGDNNGGIFRSKKN